MIHPTLLRSTAAIGLALVSAGTLAAQAAHPADDITEVRIREVLGYLSSDALAGRDTPSPGQDEAALFLAWSFAKAGLRPAGRPQSDDQASFFHDYTLGGLAFRSDTARLTLHHGDKAQDLIAGGDFRVWDLGRAFSEDGVAVVFPAPGEDPRASRRNMAGRSVRFFEVETDSPVWRAASSERRVLSQRIAGGAPVILLRRGVASAEGDTVDIRAGEPRKLDVPLRNVVALLPGTDRADEYVMVSAHYDHIGISPSAPGADAINNGADDDGTGTTAVLLLAEHFARVAPLRRSILFVCFSGEEKGLRGSRAFAETPPVPLDKVVVDVNLEMLGRPEREAKPFVWVTGETYSDFAEIARPALTQQGVELTEFEMGMQLFYQSDNASLAQKGVVAHSISAGTLHKDYHRPTDEADRIAYPHMTAVVRGIAAVIAEFADREQRPAYNDSGRAAAEHRR